MGFCCLGLIRTVYVSLSAVLFRTRTSRGGCEYGGATEHTYPFPFSIMSRRSGYLVGVSKASRQKSRHRALASIPFHFFDREGLTASKSIRDYQISIPIQNAHRIHNAHA